MTTGFELKKHTSFGLAMQTMTLASRAVLVQFHASGLVAPVLAADVVAFLALGAGQSDENAISFLCHEKTFPRKKTLKAFKAFRV
jgi:hypothetical protein